MRFSTLPRESMFTDFKYQLGLRERDSYSKQLLLHESKVDILSRSLSKTKNKKPYNIFLDLSYILGRNSGWHK